VTEPFQPEFLIAASAYLLNTL